MSDSPRESYDAKLLEIIANVPTDLESKESTTAIQNLKTFADVRKQLPPEPEPEPTPEPAPEPPTRWERAKAGMSAVWESETTRTVIKAGGAFAGVALVAWSTIHRDHVMERQALQQANQRPS